MVGHEALTYCLESNDVKNVISLVRRKGSVHHPKLTEVVVEDFMNYQNHLSHFENVDSAVFCVGVYTNAVPDEQFRQITVDYVQVFADALRTCSPDATFCLLSGAGADQTEKSRMAFARYKGMAENYLMNVGFSAVHLFRPAYIYPVKPRKEPNFMYTFSRALYPLLKLFGKGSSITSVQLGRAMAQTAIHGTDKTILENIDIHKILEQA